MRLQLIYHGCGNVIETHEHEGDFKNGEAAIILEIWKVPSGRVQDLRLDCLLNL